MLKLEFITLTGEPNPTGQIVTWRLCTAGGFTLARSAERWSSLAAAMKGTGDLIQELVKDDFEVYDLTEQQRAKSPAAKSKSPPRSSMAAKLQARGRSKRGRSPE